MSPKPADRPRPPSVEHVLARVRERLDGPRDPAPVLAVTRAVVDDERVRLQTDGTAPADLDALAAIVVDRLDGFAGPVVTAPPAVTR